MKRKIIEIDEAACNGCGLCASACHEGAIGLVGGKARLLRDDYCDGLGDCLPACPTGAITFVEREAAAYDEAAVQAAKQALRAGSSELTTWPVQIKLAPVQAPYFAGARLLVAADCTAFAYAGFHRDFMRGCVTLVGCPKLDGVDYAEKLSAILAGNDVASVTVARMQVPCCGGLEHAVRAAVARSGKDVPVDVAVISTQGELLERR
ncbi:ATP-binding protein [Arabiibacter massiliensis]|uniref:ATP-binding protein n=1 Tax=Arabiibacter massiliensis TaxID=1870985 RepID=UPI0009BBFA7C|nr:4Fe-4S dicluster domain-containing protein [Arabiibacter massiliensis]